MRPLILPLIRGVTVPVTSQPFRRISFILPLTLGSLCGQDVLRHDLPEVEVIGQRPAASRLRVPGSGETLTLTSGDLRTSPLSSIADLLRQQGGLNFTSFFGSNGTGIPQLRGFGDNASSRVLILVDGLPMTRPDLAAPVWFEFPLAGLGQVELQRGARTVRYGSSALAGVVALETRSDLDRPEWSLQASNGSWDTRLFRANGLIPNDHGWTTGVALDWFESDGYRQNSASDSQALQLSFSSPDQNPWKWQTTFNASETDLENPGGLGRNDYRQAPRQSVFTRFGIGEQYRNRLTSLRSTHQLGYQPAPDHLWQLNASWTGRKRELNFGAGSHTDHDLNTFAFDLSHEWKSDRLSGSWGMRGTLDTLALERFREQSRQNHFATADLERRAFGAFARADYRLGSRWTFSGGLSWDTYDLEASALDSSSPADPLLNFAGGTHDSASGAELALEYRPNPYTRSWLRYDRVFRFPVLDEIAGYQGFLLDTPVNTDLDPEKGNGLEWGTSFQHEGLSASLTSFVQWLDDEIIFDFNDNLNTNFANSRRLGIETRFTYQGKGWRGLLRYHWTSATFTNGPFEGKDHPLVPRHQLSALLTWEFRDDLDLDLEWEWLSDSPEGGDFANTRTPLPGRSLVHLEGRQTIGKHLEVFARIDNLFDERWASLKFLGQWYPGHGRAFTLGLRATF